MRHNSSSLAPLQSLELNPRVWMLCAVLLLASFNAGSAAIPSTKTRASLKIPAEAVRPGGQSIVQVGLAMAPGWHAYWRNPGESGAPISIEWILPTGIRAGEIRWPLPHKIVTGGLLTYGLEGEVVLEVPLQIDASATTGAQPVQAKLKWLECSDTLCVPQSGSVGGVITVDSAGADKAEPSVPRTQPAPLDVSVDGQWISPGGTNSSRRVQISWTMPSGSDSSDFFPYESDRFSVRGPTNAPVASGGKVTWLGEIDRLEGEWPLAIRGVVVAGAAGVRNSMAKEVEVTLTEGGRSGETGGIGVSVISPASPPALSTTSRGLGYYLMFAFLGGLILNIMPCVLPVISLKILGFVRQSADSPARVRKLGLAYGFGVWVCFMILAGVTLGLRAAGKAAAWGIQFGNPVFLVILTSVVLLLALSLFGVFEITLGGLQQAGAASRKEGMMGAFFNGLFAVILGTSCTAPMLGVAIGFALSQSAAIVIVIFNLVALGFALPYLIASWNPAALSWLPKPGVWMEHFKTAMGFPMLAAALWLFSITPKHYGERALWFGFFLVILSLAAWVYGTFVQRGGSQRPGLAAGFAGILLVVGYGYTMESQLQWRSTKVEVRIDWQPWSLEAVAAAQAKGKPVFVDFTADWCVTCKVNASTSIEIPTVSAKLKELGFVALLADYTTTPDHMTEELEKHQRAGVPLVLVYSSNPAIPPRILPELLSPGIVLDALEWASKSSKP